MLIEAILTANHTIILCVIGIIQDEVLYCTYSYLHDSWNFKIVHSNKNTHMVYVAGDFNVNLLAVNDTQFNSDYFDSILAAGYLPTITLPTRLSQNSTLIDNIFTNSLKDFTAVVLEDHISDHQTIIASADTELPRRPEKYVTIRSNDEQSKIKFCETSTHECS